MLTSVRAVRFSVSCMRNFSILGIHSSTRSLQATLFQHPGGGAGALRTDKTRTDGIFFFNFFYRITDITSTTCITGRECLPTSTQLASLLASLSWPVTLPTQQLLPGLRLARPSPVTVSPLQGRVLAHSNTYIGSHTLTAFYARFFL